MILVIDNYDSFVHNVARHLAVLGATCEVVRNDRLRVDEIAAMRPDAIVISPGPGSPAEAGVSCAVLEAFAGKVPMLGVCLGHQCLGAVFGGRVARARRPMHGLASDIRHGGTGLFAGLPTPLPVGRYHSLIVEPSAAMEETLAVTARSEDGEVMALAHRRHPIWGVQFHPESVLTPSGMAVFGNFLALARAFAAARMGEAVLL